MKLIEGGANLILLNSVLQESDIARIKMQDIQVVCLRHVVEGQIHPVSKALPPNLCSFSCSEGRFGVSKHLQPHGYTASLVVKKKHGEDVSSDNEEVLTTVDCWMSHDERGFTISRQSSSSVELRSLGGIAMEELQNPAVVRSNVPYLSRHLQMHGRLLLKREKNSCFVAHSSVMVRRSFEEVAKGQRQGEKYCDSLLWLFWERAPFIIGVHERLLNCSVLCIYMRIFHTLHLFLRHGEMNFRKF